MREIAGDRIIVSTTVLAGCASFFIGNAYNAQLPGFAEELGHGNPGLAYSMLRAAGLFKEALVVSPTAPLSVSTFNL